MIFFLIKYYSGNKIENNESDGSCGTFEEQERCIQGSGEDALGKEITWNTQAQMKNRVIIDLQEVVWGGINWIDLAEDWHRWRSLMSVVFSLRVP